MDGIDFLWQQVTGQMVDEMQLVDSSESDDVISCYCCGRPSGEWVVPYYQRRIDTYLNCQIFDC